MNTLINVLSPCVLWSLNASGSCTYVLINVLRSCDLTAQSIRTPRKCQDPEDHKTPTHLPETIRTPNKYPQPH